MASDSSWRTPGGVKTASVNVHHLELFYHVAKHGGITEAVRKMPYGIQQPAVSSQILQLEDNLGLKLFQRRPFSLTPAGLELFEFVEPFFGRLEEKSRQLRGEVASRLRLAAPATILREHFPRLLEQHRRKFPRLKLELHDANQAAAEIMLRKQEIDLAITELEGRPAPDIRRVVLLKLPLVLLLPKRQMTGSVKRLWNSGKVDQPLVSLPASEAITKLFRGVLSKRSIDWPTAVELSSLDLIPAFVRAGFGIGLFLLGPTDKPPVKTRVLPLPDFPPLIVAALWQGKLPPIAQTFLEAVQAEAEKMGRC